MKGDIIFGVDLESITESLYLGIPLTENIREYNVIVNPSSITYVIRKTVILNNHNYPKENIEILRKNECKIISRFYIPRDDVEYSPYLLRMIPEIVWNGQVDPESWTFYSGKLGFPKIQGEVWRGEKGEPDYLGFLAHQVGIHVYPGPYQDLDLVKIGKGKW